MFESLIFQPVVLAPEIEVSLETGIISEGSASAPMNWCDDSKGPSYGDGGRYQHEEIPSIVLVPKKRNR